MKRVSQVIRLKPEKRALYLQLHQNVWKSVAQRIQDCNIRNYSIYLYGDLLFSYFEYHGQDYEADMAKMAAHEETRLWWSLTDPCQERVPEALADEKWHAIEEVFHLD